MKKNIIVFITISFLLFGCITQTDANLEQRTEIVEWAKQIAEYENDAEIIVNNYYSLTSNLVSRYPTNEEMEELTSYYNLINYIYNDLLEMSPPVDASSIHHDFIESYSKVADSILYYKIAINQNDITYFEKSVSASKEANRIGNDAYQGFIQILDNFKISCDEINFCE